MYDKSQQQCKTPFTVSDLLSGKELEIIAAALLLSGKLKVDAVQLYRSQPIIFVTLVGSFDSEKEEKKDTMADFLGRTGDLEANEMLERLRETMNGSDRR